MFFGGLVLIVTYYILVSKQGSVTRRSLIYMYLPGSPNAEMDRELPEI